MNPYIFKKKRLRRPMEDGPVSRNNLGLKTLTKIKFTFKAIPFPTDSDDAI